MLSMLVLDTREAGTKRKFVKFWSARYTYGEAIYVNNIGKPLTPARILRLFVWKNGLPLSAAKQESVEQNFVANRAQLRQFVATENAAQLLKQFAAGGAIFRIFWLHCGAPQRFPIYDQHVHRAMRFIQNGRREEIAYTNAQKVKTYLEEYMGFHAGFGEIDPREVDKALWAFGRFLSQNNFPADRP